MFLKVFAASAFVLLLSGMTVAGTSSIKIDTDQGTLSGTLEMPSGETTCPMALIVPGSGPTDRDGNNPLAGQNNSLKLLAFALKAKGIGSLRFDKRGVGESTRAGSREEDLNFETYVRDAVAWCTVLKKVVIIQGINHVFKAVSNDMDRQLQSYGDPDLPIVSRLPEEIAAFVQRI